MNCLLEKISVMATNSLRMEVMLHPKPGLVDLKNNGSHDDMDYTTFMRSIQALMPHICNYLKIGYSHEGAISYLFHKLRREGVKAEHSMFSATSNINTHKGANFSFAVILGAIGLHLQTKREIIWSSKDTHQVFSIVSNMCKGLIKEDMESIHKKNPNLLTPGERQYLQYGSTGVRGLAEQGYPILVNKVLPYARSLLKSTNDISGSFLLILTLLISEVEDINILNRSDSETLDMVQYVFSSEINTLTEKNVRFFLNKWDNIFQEKNISPGGSADLLSVIIMIMMLEGYIPQESEELWEL
ncbi:triphosphoribosyl-dephospho-CoA synthase CitG [Dolosicoccus paucivorans]|uniref:triphosphoribosyl-dephospho-CoA synthase CitG n=1 Tax=Dolosicoccus paucivorans TaxID=84521 RepID=UPI00088F0933|nr:triphosphoribosyl-dephospho-CoA synthase CitG [Dolosicoccus paucivorans]SDI73482.1 triphosphoribosyl-dephospho-CoA synthase [Dolosicoccus paucivorans]